MKRMFSARMFFIVFVNFLLVGSNLIFAGANFGLGLASPCGGGGIDEVWGGRYAIFNIKAPFGVIANLISSIPLANRKIEFRVGLEGCFFKGKNKRTTDFIGNTTYIHSASDTILTLLGDARYNFNGDKGLFVEGGLGLYTFMSVFTIDYIFPSDPDSNYEITEKSQETQIGLRLGCGIKLKKIEILGLYHITAGSEEQGRQMLSVIFSYKFM